MVTDICIIYIILSIFVFEIDINNICILPGIYFLAKKEPESAV